MRHPRHACGALAAALAAAVLGGCSTDPAVTTAPPSHPVATTTAPPHQVATAKAGRADVEKVMTLVVENHSYDQMRAEMPWVAALGRRYGQATAYDAITHPSLPNYLAIAGGDTFGVTDDDPPSAHPLPGPSIFGSAIEAGHTAALYAEAMNGSCEVESSGRYAVKHNPWAYFVDERELCARSDVPLDRLAADISAGELRTVGMAVPDLCNDAHDCPLSQADAWLEDVVGQLMSGPDWQAGKLAIVITADEDDGSDDNHILTVVAHPALEHVVVDTTLDHYALGRSYAEVGGFTPLGQSQDAPSLLAEFGLRA